MTVRRGGLAVLVLALGLAGRTASAAEERYAAMLADGTRVQGNEVAAWHDVDAKPTLAGKAVFDAQNPFRWLLDRSLSPAALPAAYVEFSGGDRLAGTVAGWRPGNESPYETWPAHLIVEPEEELHWPAFGVATAVRVTTKWLQRVVWQRRPNDEYRPGTAFLRDGRQIEFRSLRWSDGAVVLLLNDGIETFAFGDLAEVHLPRPDAWQAHLAQLAMLTPACEGRLIQVETTGGSRLTTSTERFEAQHLGDGAKAENRFQRVQPAWSLDPLWVRYTTVRVWNFFAPHQVPLTRIVPVDIVQKSTFGSGWRWQVDRGAQGQSLRSAGDEFGWGFGVHAFHEMTFELPASARLFRTRLGLDQSVGDGGCVQARVFLSGSSRRQIYKSPVVRGSESIFDTGGIALGARPETQQLILSIDPMIENRPSGADPFDIRDSFLWLEPEIELDAERLRQEVRRRLFEQLPVFEEWTVSESDAATLTLKNVWDTTVEPDPRYRLLVGSTESFVTFSRRMKIGAEDRWLILDASRFAKSAGSRVQVRIDGTAAFEFEVSERKGDVAEPFLVSVEPFQGRTVSVEVLQIGEDEASLVDWRGIGVLDGRPELLPIFDDEPAFVAELRDGVGEVSLVTEKPHSGNVALRVTPEERSNARLPGLDVTIAEHPRMGEYRYLRFAWRKIGGEQIGLALGHDGEFGDTDPKNQLRDARMFGGRKPLRTRRTGGERRGTQYEFRYDAGHGEPVGRAALRLSDKPPEEWTVVTRDLYADFGSFRLTGLGFGCPDGDAAEFDQIYLARSPRDFEQIATEPPASEEPLAPELSASATDRREFGAVVGEIAPGFACGGAAGVFLHREHGGRAKILRTVPAKKDQPCVLRRALTVAEGKPVRLVASVGRAENGEWKLAVKVNGETLHEAVINAETTKQGWVDVDVDLSKFAGQKVLLEVVQQAGNGSGEAYWSRLEVVNR